MNKKILLVLGASSDIGMGVIKQTAEEYDCILAHYHTMSEQLQCLKSSLGDKLHLHQADFSNLEDTQNMLSAIHDSGLLPTHILHLPAPKLSYLQYKKTNWESFKDGLDTSLRSAMLVTQAFLPIMAKNKYGRIIIMLSSCTIDAPPKFMTSYVTVKYALLGLIKSLAVEYEDKGITINGVSPEMIETKFLANIPDLIVEQNANLTVNDVIPTIEFLLSNQSDHITGQNIVITGGN